MAGPEDESTISLVDLLVVLYKRKWLILSVTLVSAVLVLAVNLVGKYLPPDSPWNWLPDVYEPRAEILVKCEQPGAGSIGSLLSSEDFSSLASLLGMTGGGGINKNAGLVLDLLNGNTLKDQIAEEYRFVERYELKENPRTASRDMISNALGSEYRSESNILVISYADVDPVFATQVLNRIVELLEKRFRDLTLEDVRNRRAFIEGRLSEAEQEYKRSQDELVAFQKAYGIVDLSAQAAGYLSLLDELRLELYSREIELHTKKEYLGSGEASVVRLENEIAKYRQLIEELKTGSVDYSIETVTQEMIPEASARYVNLCSDLTVHQSIYSMFRQEHEKIKIEEMDTSHTFQVIEAAEVPELKSRPARGTICIVVTIAAFFLAVFMSFVLEYMERVKRDPVESAKLEAVRRKRKGTKGRD